MVGKQRFIIYDGYLIVIGLVFFLCFLMNSFNVEGRVIPIHDTSSVIEEEKRLMSLIGSRPPTCEMKCSSNGHCRRCVAIQVPARPAAIAGGPPGNRRNRKNYNESKRKKTKVNEEVSSSSNAYGRRDDDTPYKPLSWKCKCQGHFFNP